MSLTRRSPTSMQYPQAWPHCQYHAMNWMRSEKAFWPQMQRDGWHDTLRFGWVCPTCWDKYRELHRLKCREHSTTAEPTLASQVAML